MELSWNEERELSFGVHLKPNQQLKYLNKGSAHTTGCFLAITNGVCKRLTKLTTINESNENKKLDEIYPLHFQALEHADLLQGKSAPTLKSVMETLQKFDNDEEKAKKKERDRNRMRAIPFKMAYSKFWSSNPVHKIIKEERAKFSASLSWLRTTMSFRRHNNLREIFQADLNSKITKNVRSLDFMGRHCNCRKGTVCVYDGKCRTQIVVYCAVCTVTGKKYIGNTQQPVKTRMQQHKEDVRQRILKGKLTDSFAAHFAQQVPKNIHKKEITHNIKYKVDILWQGNPLSCVKTFGTSTCKLCAKERLAILKFTRKTPHLAINKCTEIYGACRHKPAFHRFDHNEEITKNKVSTDEATNAERVTQRQRPSSTTSTTSTTSSHSWESAIQNSATKYASHGRNSSESLADAVWLALNPEPDEPPITNAADIRIPVPERTRQGYLARSRMTRDRQSIAPHTEAWIRNADGEAAGDFLTTTEATEDFFDLLEDVPTWI